MTLFNMIDESSTSTDMLQKVEKAMRGIQTVEEADRWLKLNKQNLRSFRKMLAVKA